MRGGEDSSLGWWRSGGRQEVRMPDPLSSMAAGYTPG